MRSSYIFVYGTLRAKVKESQHTLIKQYTQYVGIGFVYGSLYNISWYPGVVLDKKSKKRVYGEIYRIKRAFYYKLIRQLDNYEECSSKFPKPHEYQRVITNAYLKRRKIRIWIYQYNLDTKGLHLIESGDFGKEK